MKPPLDIRLKEIYSLCDRWTLCLVVATTACIKENVSKIIVVTDSIHAAKKIFNSKLHPYQTHTTAILSKLHRFFNINQENSIEFWECSSHLKWRFHQDVDKYSKSFNLTPFFTCKISWDYCKKINSDDIIN